MIGLTPRVGCYNSVSTYRNDKAWPKPVTSRGAISRSNTALPKASMIDCRRWQESWYAVRWR